MAGYGRGDSSTPLLIDDLCSGTASISGKDTVQTLPATSEKGFGTRVPDRPFHGQTGDMSKKSVIRAILQDQNYKCYLTGMTLTPETSALDHIIPVSKGGHPIDARNGGFLHETINRMKGNMDLEEFRSWCSRVATNL